MNQPTCEKINDVSQVQSDLKKWLENQAKEHNLKYLLAHADDGVVWGEFRSEKYQLITSGDNDVFPQFAKLRICTLQQCRIFGKNADKNGRGNAEVMLWKVGQNWQARIIKDDDEAERLEPDEKQILWGTQVDKESNRFTLVSDGSQGLRHAVPLSGIKNKFKDGKRPLRLTVRHYIDYDEDTGVARIYLSRLVDLSCNF